MNNNYQELTSDLITTKSDKAIMFEALSLLRDAAYMNDNSKFLDKLKQTVPVRFFKSLEIFVSQSKTPRELSQNVIYLEKFLNNLPVVHLTICYEPTRAQLEQLAKKINKKTSEQTILDYTVEPNTIGLKIEFNGKAYQKTINSELE